jgi:flagellar biosynthesis/type III secretory pathway protein FliH
MRPISESDARRGGRWIRPARSVPEAGASRISGQQDLDEIAGVLLCETRKRVSGLAALERELEDRIRVRWEEAEMAARRHLARAEEELAASRRLAESEAKESRLRSEKDGRAAGFRDGFARGREEGYRLGLEEGRHEGDRAGREEAALRVEENLSGAAQALLAAARDLREEKEKLFVEARSDLIQLALEVARKIIKREVRVSGDIALRNVEKAIELIFRRGPLVVQVNPEDAGAVEDALRREPLWAQGFDSMEVRGSPDVARGGCRLLSGAGTVDMTIATQIALVADAIEGAWNDPALHGTLGSGDGGGSGRLPEGGPT